MGGHQDRGGGVVVNEVLSECSDPIADGVSDEGKVEDEEERQQPPPTESPQNEKGSGGRSDRGTLDPVDQAHGTKR